MNVSLINNAPDALRYIKPRTDAEVVLYQLLDEAMTDATQADDDYSQELQRLTDKIDQLEADIKELEFYHPKRSLKP